MTSERSQTSRKLGHAPGSATGDTVKQTLPIVGVSGDLTAQLLLPGLGKPLATARGRVGCWSAAQGGRCGTARGWCSH